MASRAYSRVLHPLQRLFQGGSVAGLSEWQLLDRYAARRDEAAFEALVARHGPMVLGVCRRMLADPHLAEDAFQATFLVLVRRAGDLGPRDAVGHWLYGVAQRVALRARSESALRRGREAPVEWAEGVARETSEGAGDLAPVLDEELGRLPSKYRAPLVLCYLEGFTHEEAARQLGWPVGSVKGRLARARLLLKTRLERRGLAPAATAGVLATSLARDAGAAAVLLPGPLVAATVRAAMALGWDAGPAAPAVISASVVRLMEGGLSAMFLTKLKAAAVAVAIAGACGSLAFGAWALAAPGTKGQAGAETPVRPTSLEALGKPLALDLQAVPLEQALKAIRAATQTETSSGVPIWVEPDGLTEAGAKLDAPVTIDARNVPLMTALDHALRPLKLAAATRDGLLVVTSRSEATLIEIRKLNEALQGKGAPGETAAADGTLSPVEWVKRMKNQRTHYSSLDPNAVHDAETEARTQAILDALKKTIEMHYPQETPLEDVLKYVKEVSKNPALPAGIPIYVDPVGLQEAEKTMTSPVTLDLDSVSLRDALRLLLKQLGLYYNVSDGMLTITAEGAEDTRTPILTLSEQAVRGELSLQEMNDLIALFEAREKILLYEQGKPVAGGPASVRAPVTAGADAKDAAIQEALERVIPLHFKETPVDEMLDKIRKATVSSALPQGVPVYFNKKRAIAWNQGNNRPPSMPKVTFDFNGAMLKTSLRLMLHEAGLGYVVKDGILIVDTPLSPEINDPFRKSTR